MGGLSRSTGAQASGFRTPSDQQFCRKRSDFELQSVPGQGQIAQDKIAEGGHPDFGHVGFDVAVQECLEPRLHNRFVEAVGSHRLCPLLKADDLIRTRTADAGGVMRRKVQLQLNRRAGVDIGEEFQTLVGRTAKAHV